MVGIPEEKNEIHTESEIACQYFTFIKCLVPFVSHTPHWPHSVPLLFLPLGTQSSPLPHLPPFYKAHHPFSSLVPGSLLILLFAAHPHLSHNRVMCVHSSFIPFGVCRTGNTLYFCVCVLPDLLLLENTEDIFTNLI